MLFKFWRKLFPTQNSIPSHYVSKWRRQWHPTPVLLPGKSHGWRSLVGCSPWGREELGMTKWLHFHVSLSCIGEGNGNPLQCSCLENPRDGGARWAAVYGVAQSQTRLKWLSSSMWVSASSLDIFRYLCVCVCVRALVTQSCPTLGDPMDCNPSDPLSIEFSRQEHWSGLACSSPGDFFLDI